MPARRIAAAPPLVEPIVPVLYPQPFDGPEWLFEPKYEGFRGLLYLTGRDADSARSAATICNGSTSSAIGCGTSWSSAGSFWTVKWWRSTSMGGRTSGA